MSAGRPKPEGTVVANPALSQTLSAIRLSGADGFYNGAVADQTIRVRGGAGRGDLASRSFRLPHGGRQSAPGHGRQMSAPRCPMPRPAQAPSPQSLLANAARGTAPESAVVAAVRQSLASFGITALPPDLGGTGFAAVDKNGQAAVCGVTMNGAFGAGRTAGGKRRRCLPTLRRRLRAWPAHSSHP